MVSCVEGAGARTVIKAGFGRTHGDGQNIVVEQ